MLNRSIYIVCFFLMAHPAKSQNSLSQKPCNDPKSSEFDFWIGNWSLTWNDTSKGTNSVNRVLDGCVVQENFSDPVQQFTGSSWSVYNPQTALWQQTWVDNQGGYIVLTGKFEKGEMILSTAPVTLKNGKQSVSRMIYYNIQRGSFDWSWENTTDNGNTWKLNWKIHYQRK